MTAALGDDGPLVMLVTDSAQLAPGGPAGAAAACLLAQAREAVEAGVDLLQIREPAMEAGDLHAVTEAIVAAARGSRTRVVVNDRLDVALAAGAAGVHLRADSLPPARARTLAPGGFLIGRSVHDPDEVAQASGAADYLVAGTVFPSRSKPGTRLLGVEGLRAVVSRSSVPVLAIGGITPDRVAAVAAAGARGVAAIGLFLPPEGEALAAGRPDGSAAAAVAAIRLRFDTARRPS